MTGDGALRATLLSFGARLLHRWYVVLFGVVLGVLGGLSNLFDWKLKLEPWMAYGIVATSLFAAALWAAFDMVSERDRAIARLRRQAPGGADPRYDSVSDTLGRSTAVAVELSKEGALIALDAWEVQTRPIVAAAYGEGEATHVFTPELKGGKVYYGTDLFRASMERPPPRSEVINNLKALLGRMPDLVLRTDFDPAQWRPFDYAAFKEVNAREIQYGSDPEWTCPWCQHEHQYWAGRCENCKAERVGAYLFPGKATERRSAAAPSPLEIWLADRIAKAELLSSQRSARSDDWYFEEIGEWDIENISQMHDGPSPVAPDLVFAYREDPRTGRPDGLAVADDRRSLVAGERERYYGQRLAWMRATLNKLANS